MRLYEIEVYVTEKGQEPFTEWLHALKDTKAKVLVTARIARAAQVNFGDWKMLTGTKQVCEMHIPYGSGLRIYYTLIEQKVVLLLAGSTKQKQAKTITQAQAYVKNYNERITR